MRKIHGLDTLRFISFLSIFFYHSLGGIQYGYLGVDFFFVLSSFLLTYLALHEIQETGTLSKRNFYIRRSLRIFPLYFFLIGFTFIVLPLLAKGFGWSITLTDHPLYYLFFVSNFDFSEGLFALKFFWSIAVEEQFYLSFILFSFMLKRNIYLYVGLLFITYIVFMFIAPKYEFHVYTNGLSHLSNFGFGILGAKIYFDNKHRLGHELIALVLSVIAMKLVKNELVFGLVFSLFITSIIFITARFAPKFAHFKTMRITEYLGKLTYGLYVYSGFIISFGMKFLPAQSSMSLAFSEFAILIPVAMISYHMFELPFLRLKSKFR